MDIKVKIGLIGLIAISITAVDAQPGEQKHVALQKEFTTFQKDVRISTKMTCPLLVKNQPKGITQDDYNALRETIHVYFRKKELTPDDIKKIGQAIQDFAGKKPARWPRPEDYKNLLEARVKVQAGGEAELPVFAKHSALQKEFGKFQREVGMETPKNIDLVKKVIQPIGMTQEKYNALREKIHVYFRKKVLNSDDIKNIGQAIQDFAGKSPARWPYPQDYINLLDARVKAQDKNGLKSTLTALKNKLKELKAKLDELKAKLKQLKSKL